MLAPFAYLQQQEIAHLTCIRVTLRSAFFDTAKRWMTAAKTAHTEACVVGVPLRKAWWVQQRL
jgi:hypothetical protein